jgi:nicotinate phosphoribosyltransferase
VGTHLVSAKGDPALTGVYKLIARKSGDRWIPAIKVSDDPAKMTNPGVKQIYRCRDDGGSPIRDILALEEEEVETVGGIPLYDSHDPSQSDDLQRCRRAEPLLDLRMKGGKILGGLPKLSEIQMRSRENLQKLPKRYRRIDDPGTYPVVLSRNLMELKSKLIEAHKGAKRF